MSTGDVGQATGGRFRTCTACRVAYPDLLKNPKNGTPKMAPHFYGPPKGSKKWNPPKWPPTSTLRKLRGYWKVAFFGGLGRLNKGEDAGTGK